MTDGDENASRRYSAYTLTSLMARVQGTDRYTIAFLLPPGKGRFFAQHYGVPEGNIREWEATTRGVETAMLATNAGISSFYGARSAGMKSVQKFYHTTDLSSLTKADLSKMDNLSNNFKAWNVNKETPIKDFVEGHGIQFRVGAAYYLLMKKEKIQATKKLLVMEKNSKNIYGGAQARALLGLPAGEVHVTPGNHANYDIYVQSTSVNRVLVRGTKLLFDKNLSVDLPETWDSKAAKVAADAKKAALEKLTAQSEADAVKNVSTAFVVPGPSPFGGK